MVNEREVPRASRLQTPADSESAEDSDYQSDQGTQVPKGFQSTERSDGTADGQLDRQEDSDPETYSSPPEHRNLSEEEDSNLLPSPPQSPIALPLPPTTHYSAGMSDSSITSALNKASDIKKLNGPEDWVEWNRHLKGHLGMVDLWEVLTGDQPEPAVIGTAEHIEWKRSQKKLASLLLLVTGPSALSLIELKIDETATEQYNYLKNTYNSITISTYSTLYRVITKCHISHHKGLKEYGEVVTNARNKLKELKQPLPELLVTSCFLDGLDSKYSLWKDMFLRGYAQDSKKTEGGEMVVPTIEEVLKELIDREGSTQLSKDNQAGARAFGAKEKKDKEPSKSRPQARGGKSSNSPRPPRNLKKASEETKKTNKE